MVIKPLEEDHTPATVKPFQGSLVEPVACSLSQWSIDLVAVEGLGYIFWMARSKGRSPEQSVLDTWLSDFLIRNGGTSGTVHLYQDGGLRLAAAVNIPEKVRQIVSWVPMGKGMAGLALAHGVPIQTCNLK